MFIFYGVQQLLPLPPIREGKSSNIAGRVSTGQSRRSSGTEVEGPVDGKGHKDGRAQGQEGPTDKSTIPWRVDFGCWVHSDDRKLRFFRFSSTEKTLNPTSNKLIKEIRYTRRVLWWLNSAVHPHRNWWSWLALWKQLPLPLSDTLPNSDQCSGQVDLCPLGLSLNSSLDSTLPKLNPMHQSHTGRADFGKKLKSSEEVNIIQMTC